jgi:4-azaleucine resistance transporter AzlC
MLSVKYLNDESVVAAFKDASPIMAGYFTVSFVFGLMCVNQGLPIWLPTLMSLFVYAGAAQFSFLALASGGASLLTTVTITFLINLRHMLMSIYMSEIFEKKGFSKRFKWFYGFGLTDESFAYHSINANETSMSQTYLISFNGFCHLFWVLGSLIGTLSAIFMDDVITIDLSFALTAMMIYVLVSLVATYEKLIIALASITTMVALTLIYESYINLFISTFVGCGVGIWLKKKSS